MTEFIYFCNKKGKYLTMKNLSALLVILLITQFSSSQDFPIIDGKISYSEVVPDSIKSYDLLFIAAKEFFLNPSFIDEGSRKIVTKMEQSYKGGTMGCVRMFVYTFDVSLEFREGRYKYELTNFSYTHSNHNGITQQIYGLKDQGPCKSSGSLEEFLECTKCKKEVGKLLSFIDSNTKEFISEIKLHLSQYEKEDW